MKSSVLREVLLYRYRYIIGYALFVLLIFGLLLTDITSVPNGVSSSEMRSSVASNSLNLLSPQAKDVINLPYHLLQKASISLFGLSPLTIRLPSLLLAFIASFVLALTLNLWFRKGIAMLTLLLGTSSVPFITMGRLGTASILYMLLLLIIMLAAIKLTNRGRGTFIWKVIVASAGLLLLYMPLGIYAFTALLIAGIIHPHVRYQIKRTKPWQLAVLTLTSIILLAPIIIAAIHDPTTVSVLLGINELHQKLAPAALTSSLVTIGKTLFLFNKPFAGEIVTPFLNLTFMLLIAFGLVRTILDRHSARAYLLLIWLAISAPLLVLNPSQFALLFVPCLMLMAVGLDTFMREWYELFPLNPYARLAALIPITLITLGMVSIAASRYFYGYYYTDTTKTFHPELSLVRENIKPHVRTQLVVPSDQLAFYDILRSKYNQLSVSSSRNIELDANEHIVLARSNAVIEKVPSKIITSHLSEDSVLLRTYGK